MINYDAGLPKGVGLLNHYLHKQAPYKTIHEEKRHRLQNTKAFAAASKHPLSDNSLLKKSSYYNCMNY